jgi:hypothetical protein
LSVKLDEMRVRDTFLFPATKMREKARRDGNRRLAFICFPPPFGQAIGRPRFCEIHRLLRSTLDDEAAEFRQLLANRQDFLEGR